MKKIIFIVLFSITFFCGKSQTFCDTNLGYYYHLEIKQDSSFNFNEDTLDFYKGKDLSDFVQINLNCDDSSFFISYSHSNIMELSTGLSEDGDEIHTSSTNTLDDNGIWKFDSLTSVISFKLVNTTNWISYKLSNKINKKQKTYLEYNSKSDYRELIRLIKIRIN